MVSSRSPAAATSDASLSNSPQPDLMPTEPQDDISKRGLDGRYVPSGNGSDLTVARQWEKNKRYRVKLRNQQDGFFRGYVRVFFISGDRRDFVPFSCRSGPFVSVFERIIKPKFVVGRNDRSVMLQGTYRNDGILGLPTELTRISVKDPGAADGRSSRIKVYRFRRLPALTREASEIRPLITWLQEVENHGALSIPWKDALKVCVNAIGSYKYVSAQEAGYIGFPVFSRNSGSPSRRSTGSHRAIDGATPSLDVERESGADPSRGAEVQNSTAPPPSVERENAPQASARSEGDNRGPETGSCSQCVENNAVVGGTVVTTTEPLVERGPGSSCTFVGGESDGPTSSGAPASRAANARSIPDLAACGSESVAVTQEHIQGGPNDTMLRYMMHFLDLVHCDDLFMVLNMLFDDRLQSKFHIIVGTFREKCTDNGVRVPYLVRIILAYAHGKVFKPSGAEQAERELCLRSALSSFVKVRELYGLKSYDEMRWPHSDDL